MVRGRLGWWLLVAVLAAGCATPGSREPTASDQADVGFMQHLVPHLLQTTSIVDLARERITRPRLARLADTIHQQDQAHLQQLQGWLARRGLAPYDPQQQRGGPRKETDLARLSRADGAKFDLAFVTVMTARHRAGIKLAAAELRAGSVPEVRQLAEQLLTEQQAQVTKMTAWKRAWSKAGRRQPASTTLGSRSGIRFRRPAWLVGIGGR
jgi:uncharacterized protein (DUF305 family)